MWSTGRYYGQGIALAAKVCYGAVGSEAGRLVCPFNDVLVSKNAFYLVLHVTGRTG